MVSKEQLEAYAVDAAKALAGKVGPHAQVIVMVADFDPHGSAPYMIERHGGILQLNWLLRVGNRIVEDAILPKPTINREG